MGIAKASRAPKETKAVRSLSPTTRLAMTFREIEIEGRKDWRNCWIFAQFAADEGDEDMVRVMETYKGLKNKERVSATPEFVCDLAGVNPNDFAAEIFRAYLSYSGDAGNLIAAAAHPKVVGATVKNAMTAKGHQDRRMLLDHAGFLPQKQGGGIHVNASANADSKTANVILPNELPTMESDTIRFTRSLKSNTTSQTIDAQVIAPAPVLPLGQ